MVSKDPVQIDVYIPFMPCACQPGKADRKATAFNERLLDLKENFKGQVAFSLYALNLHFQRFKATPAIAAILQDKGKDGLPVICIEGAPVFVAAYPDKAALDTAVKAALQGAGPTQPPSIQ